MTEILKNYRIPIQEHDYDRHRTEMCLSSVTYPFWTRLPFAASLVFALSTFYSMAKAYLGRALVLNKPLTKTGTTKSDHSDSRAGILAWVSPTESVPLSHNVEGEGSLSREEDGLSREEERKHSSAHRCTDGNNHSPHYSENSPHAKKTLQFSISASSQLSHKEGTHKTHIGKASSHSSSHIPPPVLNTSAQHAATVPRPTLHSSSTPPIRPSTFPTTHAPSNTHFAHSEAQQEVIHERLQTHAAKGSGEPASRKSSHDRELLKVAAECLHAQDYGQMKRILSSIQVDSGTEERVTLSVAFGLGQACFKMKQYSRAEDYFTELDVQARRLGERGRGDVSIANYYLGEVYFIRVRYDEAATYYQTAIDHHAKQVIVAKVFRVIPPTKSGLLSKLAASLRNGSKVMDAITAYREAIATATAKKDRLSAHTSLGNLLQNVGDNTRAVEEYKLTITLSEELNDNVSLGWAYGNIGNAYLGLNQRDQAIHHLKKALELTLDHEPTPSAIGRAYNNLGTAYQALNELDQAQEYYDLALAQAIYGGDQAGQARVYGNIGNLQMLRKKYDGAIAHYSETLSTTKDKATKTTAHHNRGCASYEKAESEKRKFYVANDSSSAATTNTAAPESAEGHKKKHFKLTYHGEVLGDIEDDHQLPVLPSLIQRRYKKALDDLAYVVDQHEITFKHIRGSPKGLTLSVSLFETNSRTFHRLQDCHYNLGQWDKALIYAEQSRARTLGELLLEKKRPQLDVPFNAPLDLKQINQIVASQDLDVVLVSYTGSRLLVWVLSPGEGEREGEREVRREVRRAMFQVTLEEDEFDGKSLDYYLRYLLSEVLVERTVEMYAYSDYQSDEHILPTVNLHQLFAKPLQKIMSLLHPESPARQVRDIIVIPDPYVNLMPLVALLNKTSQEFLGDCYRFRIMPSLLSMGVLNQMAPVIVRLPHDGNKFCVVGNPTIPTFAIKGETWTLGKLPFATEEAEWVSHILNCRPTLHEQATKSVVLMMISGARVVHLATHGSAAAGFLAFASLSPVSTAGEPADERSVLIYPEDIEQMAISPALVVLSSCDSGRGAVKADGILGMARAFILAGAQAVMTTLWRVPDESAAVFMKFFYQYLVDGNTASKSLQKAMLSIRSFSKYSGFIHWSGYQLTGREVEVRVEEGEREGAVRAAMGEGVTVFPRLSVVQSMEKELVDKIGKGITSPPTDVQVIHGYHGLKPAGPVMDFVLRNHAHFPGGIYWLNGTSSDLLSGGMELVNTVLPPEQREESAEPVLVVLDGIKSLPRSQDLLSLLKSRSTHIIVINTSSLPPEALRREIDQQLIRGCSSLTLQPLSSVHTTQRIVHAIMTMTHFIPLNREQKLLEKIVELVSGSPGLVNMTTALLRCCLREAEKNEDGSGLDFLDRFAARIPLLSEDTAVHVEPPSHSVTGQVEAVSIKPTLKISRYTSELIAAIQLPTADHFILRALSVFGPVPIPLSIIDTLQSMVVKATQGREGRGKGAPNPISNLLSAMLLRPYPCPIVSPPDSQPRTHRLQAMPPSDQPTHHLQATPPSDQQNSYLFVPQLVQDSLWEHMEAADTAFTVTTAFKALQEYGRRPKLSRSELCFAAGLTAIVVEKCDSNGEWMNESVYKEAYKLLINYKSKL